MERTESKRSHVESKIARRGVTRTLPLPADRLLVGGRSVGFAKMMGYLFTGLFCDGNDTVLNAALAIAEALRGTSAHWMLSTISSGILGFRLIGNGPSWDPRQVARPDVVDNFSPRTE